MPFGLRFLILATAAGSLAAAQTNPAKLASRADLDYAHPAARSEAGLPIGNGRMGSLLWTEPGALKLQINRNDVFGNGNQTRSFPQRHTDYVGDCAFVDVNFEGAPVFTANTHEHLSCAEGLASIEGHQVTVRAVASASADVIAIEVDDERDSPTEISVALRAVRPARLQTVAQLAVSKFENSDRDIDLTQTFTEGPYFDSSAVGAEVVGREATLRKVSDTEWRLVAGPGKGAFTVLISSAASFDPKENLAADANLQLASVRPKGFAAIEAETARGWRDFWSRSFVSLHSSDGSADLVEANYTYFLYIMGSSSRGRYPTKFNGMLWSTGGDHRQWGAMYWGANQSCYYNDALFAAGEPELMEPMYDLYTGMMDSCALAARQEWGSKGLYIPETVAFDGLAPLPKDIAAEMRDLYLMRKPWAERSQKFLNYADGMMGYASRWNWIGGGKWTDGKWINTERGGGPFGPTSHIFSRGAKIAYQYWIRYEYTGDKTWLKDRAYPILKGVAEFYRNFPNTRKEADGLYHIHYVNSNEPLWGGVDTDEEIASMRAIFPVLIKASEILGEDAGERAGWQEFVDHLAPFAAGDHNGKTVWVKGRGPVVHGQASGLPDSNTMPVWFFDECTLESSPDVLAIGNATFDGLTGSGRRGGRGVSILSKLPLTAAELGRPADMKRLLLSQIAADSARTFANRMDLSEGAQTTNIERLGNAADAVHTALCSDLPSGPAHPPVIRVFPAWPEEWAADFSLACRGGFQVASSRRGSQIGYVAIRSRSGNELRLRNPWKESGAELYRGESTGTAETGDLLVLPTRPGEILILVPAGADASQVKASVLSLPGFQS